MSYDLEKEKFYVDLSQEEVNIIATYMIVEWLGQQLASVELTRMKFSGSDFKFTSQANHMSKLKVMVDAYRTECFKLQRLYKRRKVVDGKVQSTLSQLAEVPNYGYKI
jgi:hypothetical protein